MKTPAPLQTDIKVNMNATLQRNYSNPRLVQASPTLFYHQYTPPSWAKQTSTSSPCPALQPTSLSSTMATSSLTSSTMMSSLSSSSSLLSTKNTFLTETSLHPPVSFSLTSSYSHNPLLSCSKMSTPSAVPPVCSYASPAMENKAGLNEKREVIDMLFPPEGLLGSSEGPRQDARQDNLEEDDQMLSSDMPVLDMDLDGDEEQTVASHEEFGVLETSKDDHLKEVKERKNNLLNMVCSFLVNRSSNPGEKDWDKKRSVWAIIKVLATEITIEDPEFLLKELNDYEIKSEFIFSTIFFTKLTKEKTKLDCIVVFENDYSSENLMVDINNCQQDSNRDAVVIDVLHGQMSPNETLKYKLNSNTIEIWGFSEQTLKFVSEGGSSSILQHVEHMDRLYNIPPPQGSKTEPERAADVIPLPATPTFRWKSVRVFISSTFRDMHAERDFLVRSLFPELRRRAAAHYLYLQEVDLRFGITEKEINRVVELCLSEVCHSQVLLGVLGERYGFVPPHPVLPELPQYSWLNSAPDGLSITEMEIRQFQALYPDSAQSRMLFYFRSPHFASSVPVAWRTEFVAESKEAEDKLNSLKTWIHNNNIKVTENYPCEWGGVVDEKPYVKGLEDFGRAVLEDLWDAIQQLFVEKTDVDLASEIKEQEVHQDAQQRQFHGRAKLISMATEKVQECQQKGEILMVEGNPGEGKTVFMAALTQALKTSVKNKKASPCDVISYSTDASQSACSVEQLLRCLVQWLRKRKNEVELPPNTSYKELLSEFHLNLNDLNKEKPLALLVDGADRIHDDRGQRVSEWIPQQIPKGVCLVLSVTSESSLQNTISKRKGAVSFPLGQLSLPDKKEIVQKQLVEFGKKLSDSAFNNQLQTLLMKKGSVSPLYLHLACEELKNYASFERMKYSLQSLGELVQHSLLRLQNEYCRAGLGWALALAVTSIDDFTIALWLNNTLTSKPWIDPKAMCILRGHNGGVTCITFSPNGKELLSRGKDQAHFLYFKGGHVCVWRPCQGVGGELM